MDRQLLWIKKETTYGTDPTAAAVDTIMAESVRHTLKGTTVGGDPAKPGVGATPTYLYGDHVELSFEVPLAASGTAGTAPKWGKLALACGMAETVVAVTSVTYALRDDPSASDSMTIVWRDARRSHKIVGARGTVSLKANAGERPMLMFTFRGLYAAVTAGAALVAADATFTGWNDSKPIAQGRTTFSLGGVAMPLRKLELTAGDNIVFADLPHQENVQLLGERKYTGKIAATMQAVGTYNPETAWQSRARQTLILVHEAVAGSIVTVTGQGQVDEPSYSRDKGEDVFEQSVNLMGSTLALSDDLIIVLT